MRIFILFENVERFIGKIMNPAKIAAIAICELIFRFGVSILIFFLKVSMSKR